MNTDFNNKQNDYFMFNYFGLGNCVNKNNFYLFASAAISYLIIINLTVRYDLATL